jgi:hypothetical protein
MASFLRFARKPNGMQIKLEPTYTADEVAQLLLESEGQPSDWDAPGSKAKGHPFKHTLLWAGPGHTGNTIRIASDIALDKHPEYQGGRVGFFQSRQPEAIALGLNRKSGQTALYFLKTIFGCSGIFAKIDIQAGLFKMMCFYPKGHPGNLPTDVFVPNRANLQSLRSDDAETRWGDPALLVPAIGIAGGLCIKLMISTNGRLHIRTAFPIFEVPSPQTVEIEWADKSCQTVVLPA